MSCKGCNQTAVNRIVSLAKGGFRLALAASGLQRASDDIYEQRKATCLSCEHYDFGVCNSCGCFLAAKASLSGEKCPEGRWPDGD